MEHKGQSGFTLLETLVAFGLLTILVLALSMLFSQATRAFRHGYNAIQAHQNARTAMDRIERDLTAAFAGYGYQFEGKAAGTQAGTFGPEVYFMAPVKNSGDCDLAEIGYWLRNTDHQLMRYYRVSDRTDTSTFGTYANGTSDLLATNIVSIAIEYYNGASWTNSWSSSATLPRAIKITLKAANDDLIKKHSGTALINAAETFVDIIKLKNAK